MEKKKMAVKIERSEKRYLLPWALEPVEAIEIVMLNIK